MEEMRDIAKTLPVGFYLGRKVPVVIEEGCRAYADLVKSEIHLGLGLLQIAANHIDAADAAKWDRETLLRCLLYHEVGHLLLSPGWLSHLALCNNGGVSDHAIVNIFEDERLERILGRFFMGVKFRKFCALVNKGAGGAAKNAREKIFNAIRLRKAAPNVNALVDETIKGLAEVNAATEWEGWSKITTTYVRWGHKYMDDLDKLIKVILDTPEPEEEKPEEKSEENEQKQQPKSRQSESEDSESDESEQDDADDKDGKENSEDDGDDDDGDEDDDKGGDANDGDADGDDDAESSSEDDDESGTELGKFLVGRLGNDFLKTLAKTVFATPGSEVTKSLNQFAIRLAKQKGTQAAGRWSAIHGRIDPRRDALDKERFFRRTSDIGEKMNSAIHLTLWVDCSGSFEDSEPVLNQILAATASAMKMSGGRLAVDVVHMRENAKVAPPDGWQIVARGGNDITRSFYDAYLKTRKKDRRNIDIVVFDGLAAYDPTSAPSSRMVNGVAIEKLIWDHPDCHIISDVSNAELFRPLTKCHMTYMATGYAEQLQAEVIKMLDRIL